MTPDRCRCCHHWLAPSARLGDYCLTCAGVLLHELDVVSRAPKAARLVYADMSYDLGAVAVGRLVQGCDGLPFEAGVGDG